MQAALKGGCLRAAAALDPRTFLRAPFPPAGGSEEVARVLAKGPALAVREEVGPGHAAGGRGRLRCEEAQAVGRGGGARLAQRAPLRFAGSAGSTLHFPVRPRPRRPPTGGNPLSTAKKFSAAAGPVVSPPPRARPASRRPPFPSAWACLRSRSPRDWREGESGLRPPPRQPSRSRQTAVLRQRRIASFTLGRAKSFSTSSLGSPVSAATRSRSDPPMMRNNTNAASPSRQHVAGILTRSDGQQPA